MDRLYKSESDVCRRQILTYKDEPRAEYRLIYMNLRKTQRSETMMSLHPGPRSKINYSHSSFVVAAPSLWNKLLFEIRKAKSVTIFLLLDLLPNLSIHRPSYDELLFRLWNSPLNTDFSQLLRDTGAIEVTIHYPLLHYLRLAGIVIKINFKAIS